MRKPSPSSGGGEGPGIAKAAPPAPVQDLAAGSGTEPSLLPDRPPLLSPIAAPHAPSPPAPLPPVLTADELAALLRVNRKTVYAGFKAGDIPGGQRIGGTIRFSRDAVLRWLAEGRVPRSSRGSR